MQFNLNENERVLLRVSNVKKGEPKTAWPPHHGGEEQRGMEGTIGGAATEVEGGYGSSVPEYVSGKK